MVRTLAAVLVAVVYCATTQADDAATLAFVKSKAKEVGKAVVNGDYGKLVDLTYPKIVEQMGGRDKMISSTDEIMKEMKDKGFVIRSHAATEPSEMLVEGKNTFVIVPTKIEMSFPTGKVIAKSYLLGISSDGGKTWTFVDGAGIRENDNFDELLPKLPAKLVLPKPEKPEIIND